MYVECRHRLRPLILESITLSISSHEGSGFIWLRQLQQVAPVIWWPVHHCMNQAYNQVEHLWHKMAQGDPHLAEQSRAKSNFVLTAGPPFIPGGLGMYYAWTPPISQYSYVPHNVNCFQGSLLRWSKLLEKVQDHTSSSDLSLTPVYARNTEVM